MRFNVEQSRPEGRDILGRQEKIFNNKKNLPTPNAKKTSDSILSLPMHPYLSQNKINYIIKHIHNFFN